MTLPQADTYLDQPFDTYLKNQLRFIMEAPTRHAMAESFQGELPTDVEIQKRFDAPWYRPATARKNLDSLLELNHRCVNALEIQKTLSEEYWEIDRLSRSEESVQAITDCIDKFQSQLKRFGFFVSSSETQRLYECVSRSPESICRDLANPHRYEESLKRTTATSATVQTNIPAEEGDRYLLFFFLTVQKGAMMRSALMSLERVKNFDAQAAGKKFFSEFQEKNKKNGSRKKLKNAVADFKYLRNGFLFQKALHTQYEEILKLAHGKDFFLSEVLQVLETCFEACTLINNESDQEGRIYMGGGLSQCGRLYSVFLGERAKPDGSWWENDPDFKRIVEKEKKERSLIRKSANQSALSLCTAG